MDVAIDYDRCIGAGQCAFVAPEVFDQRDDGLALLLAGPRDEGQRDAVREAVASCPRNAISMDGDGTPTA